MLVLNLIDFLAVLAPVHFKSERERLNTRNNNSEKKEQMGLTADKMWRHFLEHFVLMLCSSHKMLRTSPLVVKFGYVHSKVIHLGVSAVDNSDSRLANSRLAIFVTHRSAVWPRRVQRQRKCFLL